MADRVAAQGDQGRAATDTTNAQNARATADQEHQAAEALATAAEGRISQAETDRAAAKRDRAKAATDKATAKKAQAAADRAHRRAQKQATDAQDRINRAVAKRAAAERDRTKATTTDATAAQNAKAAAEQAKTDATTKIAAAEKNIENFKNAKASRKRASGDVKDARKVQKAAAKLQRKLLSSMRVKWRATIAAIAAVTVGSVVITATGHGFVPQYWWAGGSAQMLRSSILVFRDSLAEGMRLVAKMPHAPAVLALALIGTRLVSWNINAATAEDLLTWAWAAAWATVLAHTATAQRFEAPKIGQSISGLDGMNPYRPWYRRNGFLGFAATWLGVGISLFVLAKTGLPDDPTSAMITVATLASQGFGVAYLNWHFFREAFRWRKPRRSTAPPRPSIRRSVRTWTTRARAAAARMTG